MHEVSLMEEILAVVRSEAEENKISSVSRVKLVVGKLTNAFPHALEFAFEALTENESLFTPGAILEIEEIITKAACYSCRREFEIHEPIYICSNCFGTDINIVAGRELYVDFFEGE